MSILCMLKSKTFIGSLICIVMILSISEKASAYSVRHPEEQLKVVCVNDCTATANTLEVFRRTGFLKVQVNTMDFEFFREKKYANLEQNGAKITEDEILKFVPGTKTEKEDKTAKGTWFFSGGFADSPDMDNQWHRQGGVDVLGTYVEFKFDKPDNNRPDSVSVSNNLDCQGTIKNGNYTCKPKSGSTGPAFIKLQFGVNKSKVFSRFCRPINARGKIGCDENIDTAQIESSPVSFTYRFTIEDEEKKIPKSTCTIDNNNNNNPSVRWTYSDEDNKLDIKQISAHIQIATDSKFTDIVSQRTIDSPSTNTANIEDLDPDKTYYARVRVENEVSWGDWSNCDSPFKTATNPKPEIICQSLTEQSYTGARINWSYKDDEAQEYYRVLISEENSFNQFDQIAFDSYLKSGDDTKYNVVNLIAGKQYYAIIYSFNKINKWTEVTCPPFILNEYPDPIVKFNISKFDDPATAKTDNETLVLKTGDKVNANWSIENGTEVGLESCTLSTTAGGNSEVETEFKNKLSGTGLPTGSVSGILVPTLATDSTYNVNLKCIGKPANTVKKVDQKINLNVNSSPIITRCSIENNKNTVKAGDTDITLNAQIENVSTYNWEAGIDNNDRDNRDKKTNGSRNNTTNPDILTVTLPYSNTAFGKYTPWIKISKDGTKDTAERLCPTISNLGDGNIKEVR